LVHEELPVGDSQRAGPGLPGLGFPVGAGQAVSGGSAAAAAAAAAVGGGGTRRLGVGDAVPLLTCQSKKINTVKNHHRQQMCL